MRLKVYDIIDGKIKLIGLKDFDPLEFPASGWIREEVKNMKTYDSPQTVNGIDIVDNAKTMRGRIVSNAIGYFGNSSNNPSENDRHVAIFTTAWKRGSGISIIENNFMKVCALFTARKTIKSNWINDKDEYSVPNIDHIDYNQWNNDAIIYSLFNNSSYQTSLRNIIYKEKLYDIIPNNFFFMSKEEMKKIIKDSGFREMYEDINKDNVGERFVFNKLSELSLSKDAEDILTMAKKMIINSMEYRNDYHNETYKTVNDRHIQSWDAGYHQLKELWGKKIPEDFKKFRILYNKFDNRMKEGVYKFGFLPLEIIEIEVVGDELKKAGGVK